MLPKENRLKGSQYFKRIAHESRPFHSFYFTLKKLANKDSRLPSQFGLIVSAKVSKKSTVRNQLKRRMREIIRLNLKNLKSGFKIMLLAKNQVVGKAYWEIKEDLENLLKKARLL